MRYPVRVISCCFEVFKKDCQFIVCSIPCLPNRLLLHSSSQKLLRHVLVLLSTVVVFTPQPSYFMVWYLAHASVFHGLYSSAWCDCMLRNVPRMLWFCAVNDFLTFRFILLPGVLLLVFIYLFIYLFICGFPKGWCIASTYQGGLPACTYVLIQ